MPQGGGRIYLDSGRGQLLSQSLSPLELFILSREAEGCSPKTVIWLRGSFKDLIEFCKERGFPEDQVSAHTFRHTFAVNMLRAGKDIRFLQAVLGHESLSSTEIYVRTLSQEDTIEWHKKA